MAEAFGAFSRAGIELRGAAGFPAWAGEGILHVLVVSAEEAGAALRVAGIEVREERELLVTEPLGSTAQAADVLQRIAAAGVNIDLIYQLADGRLAIGVNNLSSARRAAADLAPQAAAAPDELTQRPEETLSSRRE